MKRSEKVAVCSRSFSKNQILRHELEEKFANVKFNESGKQMEGEELINFLKGCEFAITGLEKIDDNIISKLPDLRVISKYGVGTDMIDADSLKRHGKKLSWLGGVNKRSVSELVLALAITLLRKVHIGRDEVKALVWRQQVGSLLTNRTVGIIGCGNIGKDLVRLLQPWDVKIIAHDRIKYEEFFAEYNVLPVSMEELLIQSDIVTLHVPYDSTTKNIVSRERLNMMKKTSILINTARGGLVDEIALKECLINNRIFAAAFDVFAVEPPQDLELLNLPNFFATPHIGGSSEEAILAMGRAAIDGLVNA